VRLAAVGLGSQSNAAQFSQILNFPIDRLYFDPEGATHKALEWSPGALEGVGISAYAKLLAMLAGIGSPGTMQEVRPHGARMSRSIVAPAMSTQAAVVALPQNP
jgi:hypothetical protein